MVEHEGMGAPAPLRSRKKAKMGRCEGEVGRYGRGAGEDDRVAPSGAVGGAPCAGLVPRATKASLGCFRRSPGAVG